MSIKYTRKIHFGLERNILSYSRPRRQWSYGVMVSTQDSESCDPSSSLGRTLFFLTTYHPLNFTTMGEICHVMITNQNAHYNEDDNGLYLGRRSRSRRTQWFEFISACLISIISIFSQIVIVSIGGNFHFRTGLSWFYLGARRFYASLYDWQQY